MPAARPTSRSVLWHIMSALRKTHMFAANIYFSSFSQRSMLEKQQSFPVCFVNIHNKKKDNKTRLYRAKSIYTKEKDVFCCFKFIILDVCCEFVLWFIFWGRDYYAIGVLPRSSSSSVILLSSSGEARGGVSALCLTKKTVSDGQDFRFAINSLLCRLSVKKRPISFVLYPQINSTARFDGVQNGVRRLCETPFTAVLATVYCAHKLHLSLRSGGLLPAYGCVFNGGIINRGHLLENRVSYLRRYAVCRF